MHEDWVKIRKEKHTIHCQSCYFWGYTQVLGCGRLRKMVQGKDTLNKNQSLPCRSWLQGPLLFLHQFLHLVLILMLHNSGKITIPHYHMLLLIQILHVVLFKSLQCRGQLSIFWDSCIVFCWYRDGSRRLSSPNRSDLPFVRNGFVAIYFWHISVRQLQIIVLLVMQQCGNDCVVIGGRWTPFEISGCAIALVDGVQCKCKRKQWFVFYDFLWTCQVTGYCQISIVGNCLLCTCQGRWRGGWWRGKCQLGRCTNQRWGSHALNLPTRCSCTVIYWHHWFLPWHHCFLQLENSRCELMRLKYRELLTNQIVLYTCLNYIKPYQNILEHFCTKTQFWLLV